MDFGLSAAEAAKLFDIKPQEQSLGRSFDFDRFIEANPVADISNDDLLRRFVALVQKQPEYGWRAGRELGPQAFQIMVRPDPMPLRGIVSIEASFGDRGPSTTKRKRDDRAGARFDAQIQVCTIASRGVSSPTFRSRVDFYEPHRALLNAERLSHATKCRTPFSNAYLTLVEALVTDYAIPNDMLLGFLCSKSQADGGGTIYFDRQIVMASRAGLEQHKLDDALIVLADDDHMISYRLPASSPTTSKGKILGAKFRHQSRGVIRSGYYSEPWETGVIEVIKP